VVHSTINVLFLSSAFPFFNFSYFYILQRNMSCYDVQPETQLLFSKVEHLVEFQVTNPRKQLSVAF
jgi:hypothetical protein